MFLSLKMVLAMGAPPPAGTQPNPTGQMIQTIGMFAIMGLMFYFLLIRPQQKKAKEQQQMMAAIKAGDKIVTTGGIVGIVVAVKEGTLSIRSADTKLEILKSSVAQVTERADQPTTSNS